jgi:hypothetical protein
VDEVREGSGNDRRRLGGTRTKKTPAQDAYPPIWLTFEGDEGTQKNMVRLVADLMIEMMNNAYEIGHLALEPRDKDAQVQIQENKTGPQGSRITQDPHQARGWRKANHRSLAPIRTTRTLARFSTSHMGQRAG